MSSLFLIKVTLVSLVISNELKCLCKSASVVYESTVAKQSAVLSRKSNKSGLSEPKVDADCTIAITGTLEFDSYFSAFLYTSIS